MKEIFRKINNEGMTAHEKEVGFNRLRSFINNNPIHDPWYRNMGNRIVSPFQDGLLLHHKMLASAFVIVLLVSATGGTSIVARNSIPGDILYPVKINLNEKVQSFTAIGPEAKASIEVQHVIERLSEAEKLSTQNKLNDGIQNQLETQFSQNIQEAMVHVNTLNTSGDSVSAKKVRANVENSLQKHKGVVEEIFKKKDSRSNLTTQKNTSPKIAVPDSVNAKMIAPTSSMRTADLNTASSTPESQNKREDFEVKTETTIYSGDNYDDEKTPLLDETLKRILESRNEKED